MEQGSLGELFLTRSVTKHIKKKDKSVKAGIAVGSDFSWVDAGRDGIINAEAVSCDPYMAWTKAFNNLAMSGSRGAYARLVMLLPVDSEESDIKRYMSCFNMLAQEHNIIITGGHTQVSHAYSKASFVVCAYGELSGWTMRLEDIAPGFDIVMAGYTAEYGTGIIAKQKYEELARHFSKSYADSMLVDEARLSVSAYAKCADDCVRYMHDISWGGVYGSLWQLGQRIKHGIRIDHFSIPIRQETVELCECFNINPYMLEGTGAMLFVTEDGNRLAADIRKKGGIANVIGKVTEDNDRYVQTVDEKRYLLPPKSDELYKVIEG